MVASQILECGWVAIDSRQVPYEEGEGFLRDIYFQSYYKVAFKVLGLDFGKRKQRPARKKKNPTTSSYECSGTCSEPAEP